MSKQQSNPSKAKPVANVFTPSDAVGYGMRQRDDGKFEAYKMSCPNALIEVIGHGPRENVQRLLTKHVVIEFFKPRQRR